MVFNLRRYSTKLSAIFIVRTNLTDIQVVNVVVEMGQSNVIAGY